MPSTAVDSLRGWIVLKQLLFLCLALHFIGLEVVQMHFDHIEQIGSESLIF